MRHSKTFKLFENIGSPLLDLSNNVDINLISQIQKILKPGSSILEISCGNGADSMKLQELGFKVSCTELNPEYVENARRLGLNCIEHNTKDKFTYLDKEFDLIYSRLGLHYFTEEELNDIFSELRRIGKRILITVKVVDDIKTGKVILTPEIWNKIISKFFDIKRFEIKEGQLYGSQSKWIEIIGDSLIKESWYSIAVEMSKNIKKKVRHLKKYKLFESKSLEDIDWNLPYEETWPIVREIINRAFLKIRKREWGSIQPPSNSLEWIGTGENAKLCLRKDFYQKWVLNFQKAEEFYDDFIDFIIDMNDTISDGEVKFSNEWIGALSSSDKVSKWIVSWDVRNYLNDPSQFDKIKGHDLLELSKLINLLNHAFDVTGVKKEDINWKIYSAGSGKGYPEYKIIVDFCVR